MSRGLGSYPVWRVLTLLIGVALFILAIKQSGFENTYEALARIDAVSCLLACAMFACASLIRVLKWYAMQAYLRLSLSPREVGQLYFDTRVAGLVTPLRGGEVIPALFSKHRSELLSVTLFDRAIESFRMLSLVVTALVSISIRGIALPLQSTLSVAVLLFALLVIALTDRRMLLCLIGRFRRRFDRNENSRLSRRLGLWSRQLSGAVRRFYDSVQTMWIPSRTSLLLSLTYVAWFFDILVSFLVFRAVGFPLPLGIVIISTVLFSASNFIAPTPSGLGIGDVVLTVVIQMLGYEGTTGSFLIVSRSLVVILTFVGYLLFHGTSLSEA